MNGAGLRKRLADREKERLEGGKLSFHELVALEKAKGRSALEAVRIVAKRYPEKHQTVIAAGTRVRRRS